jgi:4-amino-4-deoxy-L-arabinose transferase-like glycosyltransferase
MADVPVIAATADYHTDQVASLAAPSERRWLVPLIVIGFVASFLMFALAVLNPGIEIPNAESWLDYAYAYLPSVQAFKSGILPYIGFYFPYPPLFLYAMTAFSYLGPSWAAALPSTIAESLTTVPVFLIARRFVTDRQAFLAGLVFVLAPMNLYYADYYWLNPPLTTLFLLVSVYFFLERRYDLSAVTLALSFGFKQTTLLVLPVLLILLWKKTSRRVALRYLMLVAALCLVVSLPYILLYPRPIYLFSIFRLPLDPFYPLLPQNYYQPVTITGPVVTVNSATFTGYIQAWNNLLPVNGPVSLILPFFVFFASGAQGAFSEANLAMVVVLAGAYLLLLYRAFKKTHIEDETILLYATYALLVLFTFNPLYKYYLVGVSPLLVLLAPRAKGLAAFVGLNVVLLLIPRIIASYVPLAVLLWLWIGGKPSLAHLRNLGR